MTIDINDSWKKELNKEFDKPYFKELVNFLDKEYASNQTIYPPENLIFNAFNITPFEKVKVIILGQDPYHGPNQAQGLSFSVPEGIKTPPSLRNIYKEINSDIEDTSIFSQRNGDLTSWAEQGVFLLNSILTVRKGEPASHSKIGWQTFTDEVIRTLSKRRKGLVFLLWGNVAKSKHQLIDSEKHLILEAAHPSPLARGAFFGCKHFSKTNNYLISEGQKPIQW